MKHLIVHPLNFFDQLFDAGVQVKDAIQTRILDKV